MAPNASRLRFNPTLSGDSVAGGVVGRDRLLDLVSLRRIRLRTFRGTGANPTLVETRTGVNAVEAKLIEANRYVIEFVTTTGAASGFNQVELDLGGLSDAPSTLARQEAAPRTARAPRWTEQLPDCVPSGPGRTCVSLNLWLLLLTGSGWYHSA